MYWVKGQQIRLSPFENDFAIKFSKCLEVRLPDARTQSDRRRLGSVTLARSRVRVRAGYEFATSFYKQNLRRRGSAKFARIRK